MKFNKKSDREINVSSTADIAFLLLIFFLVATTMTVDKGLPIKLPSKIQPDKPIEIHDRNLFKILINSNNDLMVNDEIRNNAQGLKEEIKKFVMNDGKLPHLSDRPKDAVVSFKTNRGTDYSAFIDILDEIKGAYHEIYADQAGMSATAFRQLDTSKPTEYDIYMSAKEGIPMNISIAEPN